MHILYAASITLLRATCDAYSKSCRIGSKKMRYSRRSYARIRIILSFGVARRILVSSAIERVPLGRKRATCDNEKPGRSGTIFQRGTTCAARSSRIIVPSLRVSRRRREVSRCISVHEHIGIRGTRTVSDIKTTSNGGCIRVQRRTGVS